MNNVGKAYDEFYDLGFEGDRYSLAKRYKRLTIPPLPALSIEYMAGTTDRTDIKTYCEARAIVSSDSIVYEFSQYYYPDSLDVYIFNDKDNTAKFNGNIVEFEKVLESSYNKHQQNLVDSILIFQGIVNYDGHLTSIELISGQNSTFLNFVKQRLTDLEGTWIPAIQGGDL